MSEKDKLLAGTIEHLAALAVELMRGQERMPKVKVGIRNMKAELSAEPVSYADEFDVAEDMAKLRRERDEACEGFERLRDLLEATRKTLCAPFDMSAAQAAGRRMRELADLRSQLEAAEKKAQAFPGAEPEDLRCQVLDYRQRLGAVESALDAEAVIQDYTERVKEEAALAGAEAARKDLADLCMLISDGEHSSFVLAFQRAQEMKAETKAAQEELARLKTERDTLRTDSERALQRDRESLQVIYDTCNALGCADNEDVIAKARAVTASRAGALQDVSVLRATTKVQEAERDALAAELKATQDRLEQAKAGRIAEWDKTTGALKARINTLTRELKTQRAAQEELTHLRAEQDMTLQRNRESLRVIEDICDALGCADDEDIITKARVTTTERAGALQDVRDLRAKVEAQEVELLARGAEVERLRAITGSHEGKAQS